MKVLLFIAFIFLVPEMELAAQTISDSDTSEFSIRKNSIYFEGAGNGLLWSINYDRIIPIKNQFALFVRIGGNSFGSQTEEKKYLNILCESGILLGGPRLYFDPGIGYTWYPSEGSNALIIRTGIRFQGKNGLMMRLGLLGITLDSHSYISGGLAVGFSF